MKFLFTQVLLTLFIIFSLLFLFTKMSFFVQEGFVLFAIIVLFLLLSMVWPPDSPWSPWWKTNKEVARVIAKLAKLKKTDTVYELGSGDGEALITLAKEFGATCIGVEIDPLRYYQSKFAAWRHKVTQKVTFLRKNFFDVPLEPADIVYVYLVPKALLRLKKKLLSELRPGTTVISYRYEIPYLKQTFYERETALYVYTIPQKKSVASKQ